MSVIYDALRKVQREKEELGKVIKTERIAFRRGFLHNLSSFWYLYILLIIIALFIAYKTMYLSYQQNLVEKKQALLGTLDETNTVDLSNTWRGEDGENKDLQGEKKLSNDVETAMRHNRQGVKLYNDLQFSSAIAEFKKAISITPNFPEAYNNLGMTFKRMGDLKIALKYYNEALRQRPNYPQALNNSGVVLSKLSKPKEAESRFLKAIEALPSYPDPYLNLAIYFDSSGKTFEALRYYESFLMKYKGDNDILIEEIDNRILQIKSLPIEFF